jgi:RNA polymerase sigma-70 factor (ECF subfamily)
VDYSAILPEELMHACLSNGDELAWAEFIRRFQPLIASVVLRLARRWGEASPSLIDDLVQETYLKLCAERLQVLESFKPAHRDAVYGYIKVFTTNLVHDHFKASHTQKRSLGIATTSIGAAETTGVLEATVSASGVERAVLIQEVDGCLQKITRGQNSRRDCRIFWLYYRVGLPARAIAALPGIGLSTKGVESILLRLTKQVRERLVTGKQDASRLQGREEGNQASESL